MSHTPSRFCLVNFANAPPLDAPVTSMPLVQVDLTVVDASARLTLTPSALTLTTKTPPSPMTLTKFLAAADCESCRVCL